MKSKIVFLGVKESFKEAFKACSDLGFEIIWITTTEPRQETLPKGVVKHLKIDRFSYDSIRELVKYELENRRIKCFWTLRDGIVPVMTRLNILIDIWGEDHLSQLRVTKNKYLMRQELSGTEFNPEYQILPISRDQSSKKLKNCIIKPFLGYNSIGVEWVRESRHFSSAFERSVSSLNTLILNPEIEDPQYLSNQFLLVEEYIDGEEFSVEIIAHEGQYHFLAICQKSPMKAPFFEERSYCLPALLEAQEQSIILEASSKILKHLGVFSGAIHLEIKKNKDRVVVLDIGLRIGGGGLSHNMLEVALGINFAKVALSTNLGLPLDYSLIEPTKNSTALLFLKQVKKGGIAKSFARDSIVLDDDSDLIEDHWFIDTGDALTPYPSYSGLPGFTLFELRETSENPLARVNNMIRKCELHYEIEYESFKKP